MRLHGVHSDNFTAHVLPFTWLESRSRARCYRNCIDKHWNMPNHCPPHSVQFISSSNPNVCHCTEHAVGKRRVKWSMSQPYFVSRIWVWALLHKSQETPMKFVMSVCLSSHPSVLSSVSKLEASSWLPLNGFSWNLKLETSIKSVEKITFKKKSNKNIGQFTPK